MSAKTIMRTLIAIGVVAGMSTLLAGCDWFSKKKEAEQPKQTLQAPKISSCLQWQVEPMPETSPELSERHVRNDNCVEIERQIIYRVTHNVEDIALRPNGSKISSHLENSRGIVLQDVTYDASGTNVVSGTINRNDGTAQKLIVPDAAANTTTTTTYWWDGKSVFTVDVVKQDGSYTQEVRHKNGTLWMKHTGSRLGTIDSEQIFDAAGTAVMIREPQSNGYVAFTTLRANGSAKMKQVFNVTRSYWGGGSTQLVSVEIYGDDGKTLVKKLTSTNSSSGGGSPYYYYSNNSGYIDTVETHNADGTTVIHRLDSSGSVTHEQLKNASGAVVSDKDFTTQTPDRPQEQIDPALSVAPTTDDPQQVWSGAEQSPSSRSEQL